MNANERGEFEWIAFSCSVDIDRPQFPPMRGQMPYTPNEFFWSEKNVGRMGKKLSPKLEISSPKRRRKTEDRRSEFFPYYAGFPESFAASIIGSANLAPDAVVLDPWNGSGTTTFAASELGFSSVGVDINPVMLIVARARNLPKSSAEGLRLELATLLQDAGRSRSGLELDDPLLTWFSPRSAAYIRKVERAIRQKSVGTHSSEAMDSKVAALYVALFIVCRSMTKRFRSSNPTWLRTPKESEIKVDFSYIEIKQQLLTTIDVMASSFLDSDPLVKSRAPSTLVLADTCKGLNINPVDLVLTSPPYCTRIDYTAATRVELAILAELEKIDRANLSSAMMGTVKVPNREIGENCGWGDTCLEFLAKLRSHDSKASKGYYYKTHLDYFDKLSRSILNIVEVLKSDGLAVFVVQNSHYKDIENDLPEILTEMAQASGLIVFRKEEFIQKNSIVGINSKSRQYRSSAAVIESVICFRKK